MSKFLEFFPKGSSPREQQIKALKMIEAIWDAGKKVAIGCLPTGIGKSHIAKTIAESTRNIEPHLKHYIDNYVIYDSNCERMVDDFENAQSFGAFILTITKSLQDQYQNIFLDGCTMKGKNNYQCVIDDNCTVDLAPCDFSSEQKKRCFENKCCPYYEARNAGLICKSSVLNYSMFLNLPTFLQKRQILILDEAAEFEDALVSQYSLAFNYKSLKLLGISISPLKDEKLVYEWINTLFSSIKNEYDNLLDEIGKLKKNKMVDIPNHYKSKIKKLKDLIQKIEQSLGVWKSCQFMIDSIDNDGFVVAPYTVAPLAQKIFDRADKVLMMSATLSDVETYAKSLGLEKKDYHKFEISSGFDPKRSPIICSRVNSINFKNIDKSLPKIVDSAIQLCKNHSKENGIIHTHNFRITKEFKNRLSNDPRYLFREDKISNEDIIKQHSEDDNPTVLISPSMSHGVSLDDDLGRFQIICKAPYLPLGSKRIARMFKENPKKYTMKMLDTIIQMCGRCTRSVDDYSVTYIIDGTAVDSILRAKDTLPKYFLNRFV